MGAWLSRIACMRRDNRQGNNGDDDEIADAWLDAPHRYNPVDDVLMIFFVDVSAGARDVRREALLTKRDDWMRGGFDAKGRLLYVSIEGASHNVPWPAVDRIEADGRPAVTLLRRSYSRDVDILTVDLVDPEGADYAIDGCDTSPDEGIVFAFNASRMIVSIEVLYASRKLRRR